MGTWVGGIGSATAGMVAMIVARESFRAQKHQQDALLAGMSVQMIPELTRVAHIAAEMAVVHGAYIQNPAGLAHVKSIMQVPISKTFIETGSTHSATLALAAGEFVASVKLISDALEMADFDVPKVQVYDLVHRNSRIVLDKATRLADALGKEYPTAQDALKIVRDIKAASSREPQSPPSVEQGVSTASVDG